MTDFASLTLEIDSTQAKGAASDLDQLTQAGKRAEQASTGLVRAHQQVTVSAGQQRAAMQQLSYQIGDVSTQFAMGTNPMMIFAQQGGQVIQALNMMKGEATGLIGFLGGPWGAVIMGAVSVVGVFASKLLDSGDAAATAADKYKTAAEEARGLVGAMNALKLVESQTKLNSLRSERINLENIVTKSPYAHDPNAGIFDKNYQIGGAARRIEELKQEELGLASTVSLAEAQNAKLEASLNKTTTAHHAAAGGARANNTALKEYEATVKSLIASQDGMYGVLVQADKSRKADEDVRSADAWQQIKDDTRAANAELDRAMNATQQKLRWEQLSVDAIKQQNTAYSSLGRSIAAIGGIGGTIGGIIGALGGDLGGVSPALSMVLGTGIGGQNKDGSDRRLIDGITDIFKGKDGTFGKTMTDVLSGAGTGLAVGSIMGGGTGSQLGGSIGGAIGGAFSADLSKAIGGTLGKIGGAVLPIVGGLIGGLIGSLFGKKPSGSGNVSNGGMGFNANDGGISSNLNSVGGQLQSSITKIASALGGTVGSYSLSLGMYKDYYQVSKIANDPLIGKAQYNQKSANDAYDGKDPAAALRAAISVAISQGAIQGVSAGVQALIAKGNDIEAQLQKALQFQGVFDDLKAELDPVGAALDKINRQFTNLRAIFDEAGATASDYASLEQLLVIKRKDAMEQARQAVVDEVSGPLNMQIRILELLGKSEDALAASRLLELAGMKETLQPMQQMIYQLSDAQDIIAKYGPLADSLKRFRVELLGGNSSSSYGFLAAQFRSTATAAAGGDATAMGALSGAAQSFLDAAKENARSGLEYQRAVAEVLAGVDQGIFAAETKVDYAQLQIDAIANTNNILASMKEETAKLQTQLVLSNAEILRLWTRIQAGDGIAINNNSGEALNVVVTT